MEINNISFVITTYRSEETIFNCLDSLPKKVNKIVVENSKNNQLKLNLENKYENLICYLMGDNLGYGKANNFGITKSKTNYVFILNPDAKLLDNTLENLCETLNNIDFSIAAPIEIKEKKKLILVKKN